MQHISISLFTLKPGQRLQALKLMGTHQPDFEGVQGLDFYKMLGCGKGICFSILPDFDRWATILVFDSVFNYDAFVASNPIWLQLCNIAATQKQYIVTPMRVTGFWNGLQPFALDANAKTLSMEDGPILALTRGTVRLRRLATFIRRSYYANKQLSKAPGLIASLGAGELPLIKQCTLTIWENSASLMAFAYGSGYHKKIVSKKRAEDWFSEDMFCRFRVISES